MSPLFGDLSSELMSLWKTKIVTTLLYSFHIMLINLGLLTYMPIEWGLS